MDIPQLAVIIERDGDGGNGDDSPKSRVREAFLGGRGRRSNICISGSAVVRGEDQWWGGPIPRSGSTLYYYLLFLPGPGAAAYSVSGRGGYEKRSWLK